MKDQPGVYVPLRALFLVAIVGTNSHQRDIIGWVWLLLWGLTHIKGTELAGSGCYCGD